MTRMTGGQALVKSILRNGVDTIFGLPGVQMDHFFNALHDEGNRVRVIHTRHEQGAAYMAYGYAAASGRVGTYAVVTGPGFLNAAAALSTAYAAGAPVLGVIGQIPSSTMGRGFGLLHELPDQSAILAGLTKWSACIRHPAQAPALVNEAFRQLASGRIRPVGLEAPMDVLPKETEVDLLDPAEPAPPPPLDQDAIAKAAEILGAGKRPLIFAGGGVAGAGEELLAVAEALQAPVISHRGARGVIDDAHYLSQQIALGFELWAEADVVLAVGTRLQPPRMGWGNDPARQIVLINIDPQELERLGRPKLGLVADAKPALAALANALQGQDRARPSRKDEIEGKAAAKTAELEERLGQQMAYVRVLRAALGEDDIFVDELTQVGYVCRTAFPVHRPRTYVGTGYQGTLGYGLPTALGAKVANPDRRVLSINGDGGFMFNVQELATAAQHNIPVVAVVFNDGAYGNVRRMQEELHGGRVIASELKNPDFVALAESFGIGARRVDGPEGLAEAIEAGFAANAPYLIECHVGAFNDPWSVIMPRR